MGTVSSADIMLLAAVIGIGAIGLTVQIKISTNRIVKAIEKLKKDTP